MFLLCVQVVADRRRSSFHSMFLWVLRKLFIGGLTFKRDSVCGVANVPFIFGLRFAT
jgi:hypothetical protein